MGMRDEEWLPRLPPQVRPEESDGVLQRPPVMLLPDLNRLENETAKFLWREEPAE
jgi:hypothetical protein